MWGDLGIVIEQEELRTRMLVLEPSFFFLIYFKFIVRLQEGMW